MKRMESPADRSGHGMTTSRIWRIAIGLAALSACAAPPQDAGPSRAGVHVAPDLTLALPAPASLGRSIEADQLVVAHYAERTVTFEARISASPTRVDIVCVDPLGRTSLSIHWTATGIASDKAPWVPDDLHPDNILADIVMLYWPEAVVSRALAASGGTVIAAADVRSIQSRGAEVMHAEFQPLAGGDPWNGSAHYRNLPWGYTLDIQSRIIGP